MYQLENIHLYNEEQKDFLIKWHQLITALTYTVEMRKENQQNTVFTFEEEAYVFLDEFLETVSTFKLKELEDCKIITLNKKNADILMNKVNEIKAVLCL